MGNIGRHLSSGWIWQGFLLILPVVILAVLGVRFIQQDRDLAENEARERCLALADDLARQCQAALVSFAIAPLRPGFDLDSAAQPANFYPAFFDAQGQLSYPPPYALAPTPLALDPNTLTEGQRRLWEAARAPAAKADVEAGSPEGWSRFLAAGPPAPFLAVAHYHYALTLERQGRSEAEEQFRFVAEQFPRALAESGVPMQSLANWRRWQIFKSRTDGAAWEGSTNAPPLSLRALCVNWITNPSPISAQFLALSAEKWPSEGNAPAWLALWQNHEITRALFHQEEARLHALVAGAGTTESVAPVWFWTEAEATWLGTVLTKEGWVIWQPQDMARHRLEQAVRQAKSMPDYVALTVELAGTNMFSTLPSLNVTNRVPVLGSAHAPGPAGPLKVALWLANPGRLYGHQRARAWWFGVLIVVAAAGALIGLAATRRAFRRQQRLLEMKTNFVSSVTHELRAPLASVRLMAESLERGKIAQPEKRQEYFRYMVQECRRLSGLIENVLDFARLEQGRKEFNPEPVALEDLVRQTVQVLAPYAAERQVQLAVRIPSQPATYSLACDARALQQALVNLIDNAVKHSPAGSEVAIGLEASPEAFCLWVEDHGAGIPSEEHERIFEQFYRRGSELRRESAGIGIGLTLVKHIAEAHHGRVRVRSAVGRGSRFTLELPFSRDGSAAGNSDPGLLK
jgi:signal transduction histidine kinase